MATSGGGGMILKCPYCLQPLHYYTEYADAEVKANKVYRYIRCEICNELFTAIGTITNYYAERI